MASPFAKVRAPDRWTIIYRDYPHGAHSLDVVQRLFAVVLFHVNDAAREADIRCIPKLVLNGKPQAVRRVLTTMCRNVVRKRLDVTFDSTGVLIGEEYITLNNEGGVPRLFNAL